MKEITDKMCYEAFKKNFGNHPVFETFKEIFLCPAFSLEYKKNYFKTDRFSPENKYILDRAMQYLHNKGLHESDNGTEHE